MMDEVPVVLAFYALSTLLGLTALPFIYRFLPNLPSRGFALARPLSLLVWGYLFWLLCSLGVLQNNAGGMLVAYGGLLAISIWSLRRTGLHEFTGWLKQNLGTILTAEALFILFFVGWTLVRGMDPDVAYTEKPMELAFINSILRSPTFPPHDPWLSGYAISYYYFGYVVIAMLAKLSGAASAVAFNLSSALWFAMTAAALYGVVFDILKHWITKRKKEDLPAQVKFARNGAFLAPLFVLITSTLEGLLEILHAGGIFWKTDAGGVYTSRFWSWLSILDLDQPPILPFDWIPSRSGGWLWWRGSRVIQDLTLGNQHVEVIDEFPFFSYLLSDLHPHVLAMPFAILAIGVSLNFLLGVESFHGKFNGIFEWMRSWKFWLTALILGSMAFFNTWDFPIYVGLFCLVWFYSRITESGWKKRHVWEFIKNGMVLGVTGMVLFLPFYLGFSSQAGGILPSLEFMTRGIHFWVLFGVLLVPIIAWLIHTFRIKGTGNTLIAGLRITLIVLSGLFLLSVIYGAILFSFSVVGDQWAQSTNPFLASLGAKLLQAGSAFAGVHGGYPAAEVLKQSLLRRIVSPGTWLTLVGILTLMLGSLLKPRVGQSELNTTEGNVATDDHHRSKSEVFLLILLLIGGALIVFPEFFYLRDQFGTRMNTIFKFYFQAWMLWGIAAAAGSAILFRSLRGWRAVLFQTTWWIVLAASLAYPAIMLWNKTDQFSMADWTLNGNAFIQRYNPDEYDAILWMQKAPLGIVTEAIGGSYSDYARVSTRSGQPTVLGWPGHESQWRGGAEEMGSRYGDIEELYETRNWERAADILQTYGVRYVYVGNLERSTYQVNTGKFDEMLMKAYTNESVTIYQVPMGIGQ